VKSEGNPNPETARGIASKTLILGLGNDILTDDAIGLRIAAALRARFAGQKNITVAETAEMGLSLLDYIAGFDTLVLVDAIQTQKAMPGFVHEICGEDLQTLPAISPHFLGVGEMLALGQELGLPVPRLVKIFAIEVQDPFTVSTRLTPALEAQIPVIAEQIANVLRSLVFAVEPSTCRLASG
jgi:hydrogenase maturation protease